MDVKLSEIITVTSLVKKYDNKFLALNGLNLNINQGEIIVVEDKKELIKKMGHKKLTVELQEKITKIPENLLKYNLEIGEEQISLIYTYNVQAEKTGITDLLQDLKDTGLKLKDLKTEQSTLEKIFVNLVKENNEI